MMNLAELQVLELLGFTPSRMFITDFYYQQPTPLHPLHQYQSMRIALLAGLFLLAVLSSQEPAQPDPRQQDPLWQAGGNGTQLTNCSVAYCLQCINQVCLECTEGTVLASNGTQCLNQCGQGCLLCDDDGTCLLCDDGFEVVGANCREVCQQNWYRLEETCVQCQIDNCADCRSVNGTQRCQACREGYELAGNGSACEQIQCEQGYQLVNGYCQCSSGSCQQCPPGYYLNNLKCQALPRPYLSLVSLLANGTKNSLLCPFGCLECAYSAPGLSCSICSSSLHLHATEQGLQVCLPCPSGCDQCPNVTTCLSCLPSYRLFNDSCIRCQQESCLNCSQASESCSQCAFGHYLAAQGRCVACERQCLFCNSSSCFQCQDGYTLASGRCVECAASCGECSSLNISRCQGCRNEQYLVDGVCLGCPANCQECDKDGCSTCALGYGLYEKKCYVSCDAYCSDCQFNQTFMKFRCQQCMRGFTLSNNLCNSSMQSGLPGICPALQYWSPQQQQCRPCSSPSPNCLSCAPISGQVKCTSCKIGYTLNNSLCVGCGVGCSVCSSLSFCDACRGGFVMDAGRPGACRACSGQDFCQTCVDLPHKCTSCVKGYVLVGWKCVSRVNIGVLLRINTSSEIMVRNLTLLKSYLLQAIGSEHKSKTHLITVTRFWQGSVVVSSNVTVPAEETPEASASRILGAINSGDFPFQLLGAPTVAINNYNQGSIGKPVSSVENYVIAIIIICAFVFIVVVVVVACYKCRPRGPTHMEEEGWNENDGKPITSIGSSKPMSEEHINSLYGSEILTEDKEEKTPKGK